MASLNYIYRHFSLPCRVVSELVYWPSGHADYKLKCQLLIHLLSDIQSGRPKNQPLDRQGPSSQHQSRVVSLIIPSDYEQSVATPPQRGCAAVLLLVNRKRAMLSTPTTPVDGATSVFTVVSLNSCSI